jgi:hypothetical protein
VSAIVRLVDSSGNVLADFTDSTGASNPQGVALGIRDSAFHLGVPPPVFTVVDNAGDGGQITSARMPLSSMTLRLRASASTASALLLGLGDIGQILATGEHRLQFSPDGDDPLYIPLERSPALQALIGQSLGLTILERDSMVTDVDVVINRQPWAEGDELAPAVNLVTNPTLTHDFGGTANRPDDWAWSGTTGLSAETIAATTVGGLRRGVYRFTKADGTAASLQLTTADNSYASGDVGVFSFYARVVSGGTAKMRATLQFQTNAAGNVGGLHSGTLTTLTSAPQRISVTSTAAGATTGQAQVSIQIDNDDATSVTVEVWNAQAEKTALTPFRVPAQAVAYNPTSTTAPRKLAVWGEGNAPSLGKLKVTADALTLGRYHIYRVGAKAVDILKATLHKSLRSGTLGTDTTSTADGDAIDGNVAQVAYTEPDPAFGTDNGAGGASTTTISVTPPASLAIGETMVASIAYWRENAQIAAPIGWQMLGQQSNTLGVASQAAMLTVFLKVADAADVAASTFDFEVLLQSGGSGANDYVAWVGRFTNIDEDDPLDTVAFATENTATALTAPDITTSRDDAMIVTIAAAATVAGSGSLTFTAPAGTTPTYTEQDDRQSSSTWRAQAVYTGVLATAGATGTKDVTASASSHGILCNLALNKSPAVLVPRSTVTWTGAQLPAGEYDAWLRYRVTAACLDRVRLEYGHKASPSTWIALPDFILDTRGASTFTEFAEHLMGRIAIPEDQPLDTLTVRVSAGRIASSSANLRLDCVYLAPAFERVGHLSAPTVLANGEHLYTDPSKGLVLHLASDSDQSEVATCDGPTPIELEPGYQVLVVWPALNPVAGFVDPATEVTSAPTAALTSTPRYRT